jgi:predicted membrane channel-forming protein YqfA (hemolysin III family)
LTQIVRKVYLIGNQDSLNFYFATEMLVFLGGLINVARFPERYNSGNYDTFLNSHQIMHLLVSVSLIIAFNAIAADEVTRKISV